MRTRIRRGLTATALATSALLGIAVLPGTAQAATSWTFTSVSTTHCRAYLRAEYTNANYAQGTGQVLDGAYNCVMWLEKSTNGGASYSRVSGLHWLNVTTNIDSLIGNTYTGWYWDNDGNDRARACISESIQAPESFKHCTWGW
ncbi:hypothetical protein [Streptacidiphilus melanogenes]|uniref:hypothetical protein n=1 Tax=Streptacidiphilus melanogenes TaxID=411235 RepID=UPI0005A9E6A8|nr:hypothetical protein [Streptacidiphilus melanogenes]